MSDAQAEAAAAKSNPEAYVTGGTVQASGGLYVRRDADDELLMLCRMRAFVYILSTRQVGKSSLMTNVAQMLAEEGTRSVVVDLSELGGTKVVTADQWYVGVLKELRAQLGLKVDVKPWWDSHAHLPYGQRLTLFLKEVLLAQVEAPVVVFVDEIDTTRSLTFTDDFYSAVRSVYNARARTPEFQRLSFVLVGVATPTDLIRDPRRTPFNIGQRVEITDFTYQEALPLTAELGLLPEEAERVLRLVLKWTSGHPNLTLLLLREIAARTLAGKADWSEADVDRVVDETFFGNEEVDNFSFVRDMLTIHAPNQEAVLTTYRDILRQRKPVLDEEHSIVKSHLKLSGVVRREQGALQVRNNIYRKAFDEEWVKTHMPANWPRRLQRAALAAVALFLIALLPLSIFAFYQRSLAFSALEEARRQKVEAETQKANADEQRERAVSALEDSKRERARAEEAARAASAAAQAAESAKARAEKATEAERLATSAERAAKLVAMQQTQLATQAAAQAIEEEKRADKEREKAEEAAKLAKSAADAAQVARAAADRAAKEEMEQRKLADARGQVGFARQLEIQAERAWDKSDTSAAEVFFANALAFDDRPETRGRVLTAMLRGAEKLWASPARTENKSVAVSADGRTLAFIDGERVIRLRDIERGAEIRNITAQGNVVGLGLTPDGSRLVSVESVSDPADVPYSLDNIKIFVYDLKTGAKSNIDLNFSYLRSLFFSRDAGVIVLTNYLDSLTVVDVPSGKVTPVTPPNSSVPLFADISPDGRLLAGTDGYTITLNRLDSGQPVGTLVPAEVAGRSDAPAQTRDGGTRKYVFANAMAFSPDGRRLAAPVSYYGGASPNAVIVWDVGTRREVTRLPLPKELSDVSVAFGLDGRTLTVWNNLTVENWNVDSHSLLNSYSLRDIVGKPTPTFSPDGRLIVLRNNPTTLSILDARTGANVSRYSLLPIEGHATSVNSVAFSPDGKLIASGSGDAAIIVWDAESSKLLKTLWGHASGVNSVVFNPTDRKLLASGGEDGAVILWNVETGEKVGQLVRPPLQSTPTPTPTPTPRPTASSPSRTRPGVAVGGTAESGFGGGGGEAPKRTLGPGVSVNTVAFSPNGKLLASGGEDWSIRLWDVEKQEMVGEFCAQSTINSLAFNPDGNSLASGGRDGVVRLWDVSNLKGVAGLCNTNNAKPPRELTRHKESVISVAFSPDGKVLASNGSDKLLKLWSVEEGAELYALPDQATYGKAVFSPDGVRLAVMSSEDPAAGDAIRIWNWSTRKILTILRNQASPRTRSSSAVTAIAFSPDGTLLATGRSDKRIQLWRLLPTPPLDFSVPNFDELSAIDPGGRLLAYAAQTSPTPDAHTGLITIREVGTGKTRLLSAPQFDNFSWSYFTFSADGKLLASIGAPKKPATAASDVEADAVPSNSTAVIWNVEDGRVITSSPLDFPSRSLISPSQAAFSSDGRWFALCDGGSSSILGVERSGDDKSKVREPSQRVALLDIKSGALKKIQFEEGTLWSVAFSPDGVWMILGGGAASPDVSGNKRLQLLNLSSGEKVTHEVGLGGAVLGMVFGADDSAGGQLLALSSGNIRGNPKDPTLKLVKFPSLEPLPLFQQFTESVPVVIFVPGSAGDNKLMVTQSAGIFRLWDLGSRPLKESDGLALNTDSVSVFRSFGTDGRRLLIARSKSSPVSIDLTLPTYLLRASAKEILERSQRRTSLYVTGLDKVDFPILSQQELELRLKDKYDFSFSLLPLPESPADQKPQSPSSGQEGGANIRP